VGYAGALMSDGHFTDIDDLLRVGERWLAEPDGMVVVDDAEARLLPGAIAMYRSALARFAGDLAGSMAHAERGLELIGDANDVTRGGVEALLGLGHWELGDLHTADRWYTAGMADLERAGYVADVVGGSVTTADLRIARGQLGAALAVYERGLARATPAGGPALRGAADMHVGIASILLERNDLTGAAEHVMAARALGDDLGFPKNPTRMRLVEAALRELDGNPDGALALLEEAEQVFIPDFSPNVRPIPALRARLWIRAGRLEEAWGWARDHRVAFDDDPAYVGEFDHATLARLALATGVRDRAPARMDQAIELAERWLRPAEAAGREGGVLDLRVVHAVALHARGNVPAAFASLDHALAIAAPEGHVRVFLDEGAAMTALLQLAEQRRGAPAYLRALLGAASPTAARAAPDRVPQRLVEPLSDRELDVLRLLATDLSGPEIAGQLFVSLNTLRTHTKNIFAKLEVNNRRAAISRARELGLL